MTRGREVHVEQLMGLPVRATNGRVIGRIEEIRAERVGNVWRVTAYLLGSGALRERFSLWRRMVPRGRTTVVCWNQLDLSDPAAPRLTCGVDALSIEAPDAPEPATRKPASRRRKRLARDAR